MKRLFILCALALLMSCVCTPQMVNQTLYVNDSCEVVLPDYTVIVRAQDNCDIVDLSQDPEPGLVLGTGTIPVTITATDLSSNITQVQFDVYIIDTIPPTITIDTSALAWESDTVFIDAWKNDSILNKLNLLTINEIDGERWGVFIKPGSFVMVMDSTQMEKFEPGFIRKIN